MKIPECLVGFLEAFEFYLLSLSTSSTFLPLVLVLAAKAIYSHELWVTHSVFSQLKTKKLSKL